MLMKNASMNLPSAILTVLRGYPYDNSAIESFHASLKKEEVYQTTYTDFEAAKRAIFRYIEGLYNQNHIHSSIGYQTPNEFEKSS